MATTDTRSSALTALFRDAPSVRTASRAEVLDYAHNLQDLGLFLFPVRAGEKRPATVNGFRDATCDHDTLDAMYRDGMNLGCHLGPSRVIVVDMDTTEAVAALRRTKGFTGVPSTLTVATPGTGDGHAGGGHLWLDAMHDHYTRPVPGGRVEPVADDVLTDSREVTLATGGDADADDAVAKTGGHYVLIPGCVRDDVADPEHDTYVCHGSVLSTVESVASRVLRAVVAETLRYGERKAAAQERHRERAARLESGEADPIDVWDAATPWSDILEPHGWTVNQAVADCGCHTVARPGKGAESRSGVAHEQCADSGHTVLYLFTSGSSLPEATGMSKLQAVAALEHHGDVSAAMESLGLTPATPMGTPLSVPALEALAHAKEQGAEVVPFAPGLPSTSRWNHPLFSGWTQYATQAEAAAGAELLGYVRRVAMGRRLNPYALGFAVLQELSLYVPANVVVSYPTDVSLNTSSLVLGKSSSGKSTVYKVARAMVSPTQPGNVLVAQVDKTSWGGAGYGRMWADNEGEEIDPAELTPATANLYSQRFIQDEVKGLVAEVLKPTSTVIPSMTRADMGEALGAANSDRKNRWFVPAHTYRGVNMVAGQTSVARPMFTGDMLQSGGTARFMVFHAGFTAAEKAERRRMIDSGELDEQVQVLPSIKRPAHLDTVDNPVTGLAEYATAPEVFALMERLADDVDTEERDDDDDADLAVAHDVLKQRKVATLLAIACGGGPVNLHWWTMAGFIMDAARADLREIVRLSNVRLAREAAGAQRAKLEASTNASGDVYNQRLEAVVEFLKAKATGDGCKWSEVTRNGPARRYRDDHDTLVKLRADVADTEGFTVVEGPRGGYRVMFSTE